MIKLDELPQIVNVLSGDMSIVGPRPEDPEYVTAYSAEQRQVLSVGPGITCLTFLRIGHEQAVIERAKPASSRSTWSRLPARSCRRSSTSNCPTCASGRCVATYGSSRRPSAG